MTREEDQHLAGVIAWCRNRGYLAWHTENERRRTPAQAAEAKRKGLLAGVADVIVVVPDRRPVAIELKLPGETPSAAQRKWLGQVRAAGWLTFVGDGLEAIEWLKLQLTKGESR